MFWADKLLENVKGPQVVEDAWTPSGSVHMGSLKGPVIHDVLFKILKEKEQEAKFIYGFDDFDPIDGLPPELTDSHSKYLGVPISIAPSPDGSGSFGDYFGNKMETLLDQLDVKPEVYKTSEVYKSGKFDDAIKIVLDNADKVRKVYAEIYKKEIDKDWFPFQVICPACGKLGTTKVTGWDGKEVSFECLSDLVKWAKGCGEEGKISPFGGNGKMPWKVEWAAAWYTFGVTIEGAGKDHGSAGGSYDVAMQIVKDVFGKPQPLKIVYEFFLSGGKKMSASKGIGMNGEELLEVLPPQVARFLMIKTPPNQQVEFNPYQTLIIPKLFDDYQKASLEKDTDLARAFELSQIGETEKVPSVRFQVLAQWVQMPNMEEEISKEGLEAWAKYARVWVEKYAPEEEKFEVKKELPDGIKGLSADQKKYLLVLAEKLDNKNAEEFQTEIYELSKELETPSKDAFASIYISLLGKDHGPKAAWLILSLDKEFVKKRFEEASASEEAIHADEEKISIQTLNKPEIFSIDKDLSEKFPSVSVGVAIIKGVLIKKTDDNLEQEKQEFLLALDSLKTEQIGEYSEVTSYRKLYKDMGIDWHSRRPSPEALLRRIALKKGLYSVNTCVDAYNLVVMKHRVSIGAFDLDKLKFPTVLRLAKEGEEILLLGDSESTKYKSGEVAYFDQEGGFNIDFNYRDAQRTAVQLDTKNLYVNVDGVYDVSPQMVKKSLKEACDLIIKYCGGTIEEFGVETS